MSGDAVDLMRQLDAVDRRIDNMRFLVRFQEEKRQTILDGLRRAIGRTAPRLRPVGPHAGCAGGAEFRAVRSASGERHAVHVDDVALLDMQVLMLDYGFEDEGWAIADPGRQRGMDDGWWRPAVPTGGR